MKIIKLNKKFIVNQKYNHRVGLKFTSYWSITQELSSAEQVEKTCERILGPASGRKMDYGNGRWCRYFGDRRDNPRPYYITFRDERDLTMVLLAVQV